MQTYIKYFLACLALLALALSGCGGGGGDDGGGGGGGGGGNNNQVTIRGVVDDGTATSPIPGADCEFLDQNDVSRASAQADANGAYSLQAPIGITGSIVCTHPNFPNLKLIAFVSTVGQAAGGEMVEDLTPESSMVHHIIISANPGAPQALKEQLQGEINAGNAAMSLLAEAATILFNAMLDASLDFNFQNVLDDLMADGRISLQELQSIIPEIEQAIAAAEQRLGMTLVAAIAEKLGRDAPPVAQDDAVATDEDTPVTGMLLASDLNGGPLTFTIIENGALGAVEITDPATGAFTYTPNADANGVDDFRFVANDGVSDSAPATVTVTINPVNDLPVAQDDAVFTNEDMPITINVLQNDTDIDGDALAIDEATFPVMVPSNGAVIISDSSVLYTPNANFTGEDAFSYLVCDNGDPVLCSAEPAIVTVSVTAVGDQPIAQNDTATTDEDNAVVINVLQNDIDPDGGVLSIDTSAFPISPPSHGVVAIDGANILYTPNANFAGDDAFSYRVCNDGAPALCSTNAATVAVTVNPVDDPPVAVDDGPIGTDVNTPVEIPVLANDINVDSGDTLTITAVTPGAMGTVAPNGTAVVYTPNSGFQGPDMFTYTISDGQSTDTATVRVVVTSDQRPPVAQDDAATTPEDTAVTINVLLNDTDPDGDNLSIDASTFPVTTTNGMAVIDGVNVIYTPNANFSGEDTFSYRVCDDGPLTLCSTNPATVRVTVTGVAEAPVAQDDAASTNEDMAVTINVLENDTDPDDDTLSIDSAMFPVTGPSNGVAVIDGLSVVYTPNENYAGPDAFTYRVCDDSEAALCSTAAVNITVNPVADAPVAQDDDASTDEDIAVTINVLENDTDPDGDTLSIDSSTFPVAAPSNGVAVIDGASVVYTPNENYSGPDAFSYQVCDDSEPALCSTATVNITVNPVADAPVALDDTAAVDEDNPVTINVLENDTDPDGGALSIDSSTFPVAVPSNGAAAIDGASILYTPNENFFGEDTFTYHVCDDGEPVTCSVVPATVTVTVNPVNDLPVITQAPPTQMSIVGRAITPLNLPANMVVTDVEDGDCAGCVFTLVNQPAYLAVTDNVVSGNLAFNAFGLNLGSPVYNVEVRVEDSEGGLASAFFDWRVAQEQVDEIAGEDEGGEGGDGDADGDADGGAEGDAGDGGDASPLAGAICRMLDLDGMPVLDNAGAQIIRTADADGRFLLPIPEDLQNPGFLRPIEGFIECHPPGQMDLAVSTYFNARGMRSNERLRNLKVDPTTTLTRKIAESYRTAQASRDMVGIQARFLDDTSNLETGSPREATTMELDDETCVGVPDSMTEVTDAINIPLLDASRTHDTRNAGMAAYAASQLYLAAFKGEAVGSSTPIQEFFCLDDDETDIEPQLMDFSTALNAYYTTGAVTAGDLAELGLTQNEGLVTGPTRLECG